MMAFTTTTHLDPTKKSKDQNPKKMWRMFQFWETVHSTNQLQSLLFTCTK